LLHEPRPAPAADVCVRTKHLGPAGPRLRAGRSWTDTPPLSRWSMAGPMSSIITAVKSYRPANPFMLLARVIETRSLRLSSIRRRNPQFTTITSLADCWTYRRPRRSFGAGQRPPSGESPGFFLRNGELAGWRPACARCSRSYRRPANRVDHPCGDPQSSWPGNSSILGAVIMA